MACAALLVAFVLCCSCAVGATADSKSTAASLRWGDRDRANANAEFEASALASKLAAEREKRERDRHTPGVLSRALHATHLYDLCSSYDKNCFSCTHYELAKRTKCYYCAATGKCVRSSSKCYDGSTESQRNIPGFIAEYRYDCGKYSEEPRSPRSGDSSSSSSSSSSPSGSALDIDASEGYSKEADPIKDKPVPGPETDTYLAKKRMKEIITEMNKEFEPKLKQEMEEKQPLCSRINKEQEEFCDVLAHKHLDRCYLSNSEENKKARGCLTDIARMRLALEEMRKSPDKLSQYGGWNNVERDCAVNQFSRFTIYGVNHRQPPWSQVLGLPNELYCCKRCMDSSNCVNWSFDKENRQCQLMDRSSIKVSPSFAFASGSVTSKMRETKHKSPWDS